jgi:hypothetical protein
MMQEIVAMLTIAVATAYVVWYVYYKMVKEKDQCEGCAVKKLFDERTH